MLAKASPSSAAIAPPLACAAQPSFIGFPEGTALADGTFTPTFLAQYRCKKLKK
jgi:hypothetical protein